MGDLRTHFSQLDDDELLTEMLDGRLTAEAAALAREELRSRGVDVESMQARTGSPGAIDRDLQPFGGLGADGTPAFPRGDLQPSERAQGGLGTRGTTGADDMLGDASVSSSRRVADEPADRAVSPPFFPVAIVKLVVLTLVTAGLYPLYWF